MEGLYRLRIPRRSNSKKSSDINSQFLDAVTLNNISLVEEQLSKDPKPALESTSALGQTALHISAQNGFLELSSLLVPYSNIEALDNSSQTPLFLACKYNQSSVAELLIESGALIDTVDNESNTPLHHVIRHKNIDLITLFVGKNPDFYRKNNENIRPIDIARQEDLDCLCFMNKVPSPVRPACKSQSKKFPNFEILKVLKRPSIGEVIYLIKTKHSFYCMKVLNKDVLFNRKINLKQALRERKILTNLNHVFICKMLKAFQSSESLFLIYDYCAGGDLARIVRNNGAVSEDIAKLYMAELILATRYLHSKDIIYRNFKLKNIEVCADGHIKIINFNHSKDEIFGNKDAFSFFMSTTNLSPEILHSEGHGKPADIYMLGTVLYELVTGKKTKKVLIYPSNVSPEVRGLISRLLQKNPEHRISLEEVISHPFFDGINWEDAARKKLNLPRPEILNTQFEEDFDLNFNKGGSNINNWSFEIS